MNEVKDDRIVRHGIKRHAEGVKCDCGGYADRVDTTESERIEFDACGRYRSFKYECCSCAFVCAVCHRRIVGTMSPPEME